MHSKSCAISLVVIRRLNKIWTKLNKRTLTQCPSGLHKNLYRRDQKGRQRNSRRLRRCGELLKSLDRLHRAAESRGMRHRQFIAAPGCRSLLQRRIAEPLHECLKAILAAENRHKSSRIVFRAENAGKWHIVDVLDNGIGIPPTCGNEFGTRCSQRRLASTTPRSGMGLGLSLVKQLVEQMKGRPRCRCARRFSTCVRVQFRKADSHGAKYTNKSRAVEDDPKTGPVEKAIQQKLPKPSKTFSFPVRQINIAKGT